MGKKAKKFKAFAAGLLALVMTVTSLAYGTVEAEAKQFTGSNFGVGFAGEEYATMHRADGWSNGGMFNCTWRAANIWFNGYLNIKIDRDYATGGYSAGEYRTNDTFGYGMYDVSFKAIKNPGVVTSFFTYTGPSDGTVWDEIDIEVLGKDTTKVQFNYYTKGQGNHEYLHNLGFDASYGFHQYGFLWQPGRITWYVDGKAVHTATNNIPTTPGKIMMNVWPGTGVDEWLGRYNGVTPLVGSYDWINWKPVDNGSSNNNNNNNWNNNNNNNNNNSSSGMEGIYFIKNVHSGKYLDVAGGSNANNTNVQQWDRNGHNAQKFKLVSAGNGYYYLYTGASGYSKVVDVAGRSSADGANVLQYSFSGASNQQFKLQRQSDGSYAILSRVSGDRSGLDVYNWSTSAGGNVCQWNFWGGACQKWILEKTW